VALVFRYPDNYCPEEVDEMQRRFRKMLGVFRRTHLHESTHRICTAWECAKRAHSRLFLEGDRRKNGYPYLYHPLAVGTILAEWGMDAATLAAGLLHDCAEDTDVNIDEIRDEFGEIIAGIVDRVTKVKGAPTNKTEEQAAYIRKMLRAMRREIRVSNRPDDIHVLPRGSPGSRKQIMDSPESRPHA
jgi:guanosine-3',5'-bis(diphosphate) 3'-pyrophosphohydrolase